MGYEADERGICPSCELSGPVGRACSERVCAKRGYHFVPPCYLETLGDVAPDAMVGRTLGDYLVVGVLGAGGFGKVFLALQLPILMKAALKLLHTQSDEVMARRMVEKFEGEARALARLAHPNIVRLLKFGEHEGAPYLVMEFVEGARTLQDEVAHRAARGEEFEPADVRGILAQVLDGLGAAHRLEIVHRDMKPDNIMLQDVVGNPTLVRILDFGLAKFVDERTETSMVTGTPSYMAPEQLSARHLGPWTDLYAVGVMAFELMTGRRPYPGRTHQEIFAKKLDPAYDPAAVVADLDVPAPALGFFRRALARDPEQRYRTATAMRDGLDAAFKAVAADPTLNVRHVSLDGILDSTQLAKVEAEKHQLAAERSRLADDQARLKAERERLAEERTRLQAERRAQRSEHAVPDEDPGATAQPPSPPRRTAALVAASVAAGLLVAGLVAAALWPERGRDAQATAEPEQPKLSAPAAPDTLAALDQPKRSAPAAPLNPAGLTWVELAGGSFQMGTKDGPTDERPVHEVTLQVFEMAKSETTVAQYGRCVDGRGCKEPKRRAHTSGSYYNWGAEDRGDHPVNGVTWDQSRSFCGWAGGRLCTEAEWEYAARSGGRDVTYPWGDEAATCGRAVMDDGSGTGSGCGRHSTWPVCEKAPGHSQQNICDLAGNVWEWVQDCYHSTYTGAPSDGTVWKDVPADDQCSSSLRVDRGGSFYTGAATLRAGGRYYDVPGFALDDLGFRCCRSKP